MNLTGWGRKPAIEAAPCSGETTRDLTRCLPEDGTTIARGLGRSYGDSALNHHVTCTGRLNKLLEFDSDAGWLTCESGVSLGDLLRVFVPRGWFLPVSPGTKYVTVGGAVASDIHGKNHHQSGCFSNFVDSLELMLPDGSLVQCSRKHRPELFLATCGGMGLTGIITKITFRLVPIQSGQIRQTIIQTDTLGETFELFDQFEDWSYTVAWVDGCSWSSRKGRSIFIAGNHSEEGDLNYEPVGGVNIPFSFPHVLINSYTIKLFNNLYYRFSPGTESPDTVSLDRFFYPLDVLRHWNRLYGSRGLIQYQVVFPPESSYDAITEMLNRIEEGGFTPSLGVLKKMGPANDNYLSFPMRGYTIALDFKRSPGLMTLLDDLDELVLQNGGRHYLTKDARLSAGALRKSYPDIEKFISIRKEYGFDTLYQSLQSRRLKI